MKGKLRDLSNYVPGESSDIFYHEHVVDGVPSVLKCHYSLIAGASRNTYKKNVYPECLQSLFPAAALRARDSESASRLSNNQKRKLKPFTSPRLTSSPVVCDSLVIILANSLMSFTRRPIEAR